MKKQYRNNFKTFEAVQLTPETLTEIAEWCGGVVTAEYHPQDRSKRYVAVNVPTIVGAQRASEGDWVVGDDIGHYVVAPEEFEKNYELIDGS